MAQPSPRVLLADRHAATRAGLRAALERERIAVAGEAADAGAAAEAAHALRPDVAVIAVDLPGGGVPACSAAARAGSSVVMLAPTDDAGAFFAALRAGAAGYLPKQVDGKRLADDVRWVASGGFALDRSFVAHLARDFRERAGRAAAELTHRERDVLLLLARGLATKEIAARLDVRPTTVRRHLSEAMRKLGAHDRRAAVERFDRVHGHGERA